MRVYTYIYICVQSYFQPKWEGYPADIRMLQTVNIGTVLEASQEFGQVQVFVSFRGKPSCFAAIMFRTTEPTDYCMSCHPYFKAIYHSGGTRLIFF